VQRFAPICRHTADIARHTDITLQDVPNRQYMLRLFLEDKEIELQKTDNQSWTPVQRQYALCFLITYVLNVMRVQRRFFDFQDPRGNTYEDGLFHLGKEPTEHRRHRHPRATRKLFGFH